MSTEILYQTKATAKGGRSGHVQSADGVVDLKMAVPKEIGGSGETAANPETLFACGYAACFEGACRVVAHKEGFKLGEATSATAEVGIGPRSEGGFGLAVNLSVHLDGLTQEQAEKVAHIAHTEVCPYSHATRGNIEVNVTVV